MFRPDRVTKTRASTEMWVPCSKLFPSQISLRTGGWPKFDEPANRTKIVQSRKRPPQTGWTEKEQTSPIVPAMAFLVIASGFVTLWTIVIHVSPAMAGSVWQQSKSD